MNLFDDRIPEEQDPQNEELITLLRRANLNPMLVDPTERTQILSQVRARLFPTEPEILTYDDTPTSKMRGLGSFPSRPRAGIDKPHRGRRLLHLLNMLAAVLVLAALLGTSLLLFQHRIPSTGHRPASATQTSSTATAQVIPTARVTANSYDSFVSKYGIMFGFDAQHTHFNPFEHMLNPTTVGDLTKKWAYYTGGTVFSSPAVASGVVYGGTSNSHLYALDAATGMIKWAYDTGGSQVNDSPAVVGGVVYFSTDVDHTLHALDAATGKKKWAYQTRSPIGNSSPAAVGGVVYFGSWDGNVYALDAATGAKKWASHIGHYIDSPPAVAGGVVYVGSDDGNVYALDAATGAKKWASQTGNRVETSPAVADGVVYVGSVDDGTLYTLDAATGAKKWTYRTNGQMFSSPTVANGVVYVGSDDGNVYALDAVSGAKKWAYPVGMMDSLAAVADGVVYVGAGGGIYAFHLPGT
jgi:outer membrane protein assembly factor BamB